MRKYYIKTSLELVEVAMEIWGPIMRTIPMQWRAPGLYMYFRDVPLSRVSDGCEVKEKEKIRGMPHLGTFYFEKIIR